MCATTTTGNVVMLQISPLMSNNISVTGDAVDSPVISTTRRGKIYRHEIIHVCVLSTCVLWNHINICFTQIEIFSYFVFVWVLYYYKLYRNRNSETLVLYV